MDRDKKIRQLRELEDKKIVAELCPRENYWHFHVLRPDELPPEFRTEYDRLGELRW